MARLTIQPAGPRDLRDHRAQYDELVAELQANGYDAELRPVEQRGGLPIPPDVVIHVGEWGATIKGVADLAGVLRRVLRGLRRPPTGEPRRAVIYGPDGEVLSAVELDGDE